MVKLPEKQVLPVRITARPEPVPSVSAKVSTHQHVQPLLALHDAREIDDRVLVVEVLAPRDLRHGQVVIDQEDQHGKVPRPSAACAAPPAAH